MKQFDLPQVIAELVKARRSLKKHYDKVLERQGSEAELRFTLDGNLVGDIGEAIAVELFDIRLVQTKAKKGIDGYAPDGRTVQIKASGTARGPAFRCVHPKADHLLFFDLDFINLKGTVIFNGPEHYAANYIPKEYTGQRSLSAKQIREANNKVSESDRLKYILR